MSKIPGPLNEDEMLQILSLVDRLEQTDYDFVQLQIGELKLTLSKGVPVTLPNEVPTAAAPIRKTVAEAAVAFAPAPALAPALAPAWPEGTVAIASPMVGRFYIRPEPGAPPFVTVGTHIDAEATVALIEVMKVFSAAKAGVGGVIVAACVQDGDFVEFGQTLYWVRPD